MSETPAWAEEELAKQRRRLRELEVDVAAARAQVESKEPLIRFAERAQALLHEPMDAMVLLGRLRELEWITGEPRRLVDEYDRVRASVVASTRKLHPVT